MLAVVAYCRLSKEDGDDDISSSIVNQRKILEDYAAAHEMCIKEYYIDDGYSGYTMDRPDFNRLKNDLNNDKVDIIIAKDLSRIGRHNAKVQLFLENIIETGKRVITIGDGYDSYNTQSHDIVGIQTWVNEKYVRDVSNKVRKAIDAMQKEGRYISCVPYGYYIDPFQKNVYHIDETCAMYVKEIFDLYLSGLGSGAIARNFTERNVPTATMVMKQRLERQGKTYKGRVATRWAPNTIMDMLKNNFYIGTLTLGKTKKRSINGKKIKQPEEKQYVFEDAHEPIIDKQTFKLVQETILERTTNKFRGKRIQERPNIFTGVLRCADCNSKMTSTGNRKNTRYVCKTYNMYGTSFCTSHSITENELTEALIFFLEHCRDNLSEAINDLDDIIKKESKDQNGDVIQILENDLKRIETELKVLLEQKMRETMKNPSMVEMIDEMYSKMINEKYTEINSLKTQLQDQRTKVLNQDDITKDLNTAMNIFNDIINSKIITKRQVATIVDKIIVHEDSGLDVYLKGNLHDLCTNYIQIKNADKGKILQATIDYIENHQENTTPTNAWEYSKLQGCHIGYQNYTKIFSILIDDKYLVKNKGYNKGYRLTVPFKKLKDDFLNNIIDYNAPVVTDNNVTIEIIISICEWVQSLQYKKNVF